MGIRAARPVPALTRARGGPLNCGPGQPDNNSHCAVSCPPTDCGDGPSPGPLGHFVLDQPTIARPYMCARAAQGPHHLWMEVAAGAAALVHAHLFESRIADRASRCLPSWILHTPASSSALPRSSAPPPPSRHLLRPRRRRAIRAVALLHPRRGSAALSSRCRLLDRWIPDPTPPCKQPPPGRQLCRATAADPMPSMLRRRRGWEKGGGGAAEVRWRRPHAGGGRWRRGSGRCGTEREGGVHGEVVRTGGGGCRGSGWGERTWKVGFGVHYICEWGYAGLSGPALFPPCRVGPPGVLGWRPTHWHS
jgi:hypothetical protein